MAKDSRKRPVGEGDQAEAATSLETIIRRRARELIDAILEEELEAALGGSALGARRHGTPAVPTWDSGADVDDESGTDHLRHAPGTRKRR